MVLDKYAAGFYECGRQFAVLEIKALQVQHAIIGKLPQKEYARVQSMLTMTRAWCLSVGAESSVKALDWALSLPRQEFTYKALKGIFGELRRRIEDDLDGVLLLSFPTARLPYYDNAPQFGSLVAAKFSKANQDIQEAGKCLALARPTACVFHLMRVMEIGVQQLGKKLGVPNVEEIEWQKILNGVNGAIKKLGNPSTPITAKQRRERDKYAQAAVYLENVKNAWRNNVMHPKASYTDDEAAEVFRTVKRYMEHLVAIL